ncbi:hypothetical protein BXZ70DRAFT_935482 [Cristinia sonorae]|uniref:Uncharacterized protein n=1 Tax=Cristinia sonorae TaxID=1940300 RepID=A0A8K0UQJ4_9AGAR|nr:hypothetical protein BXZ70DRAFT_935482 [Cristinia sonorae]
MIESPARRATPVVLPLPVSAYLLTSVETLGVVNHVIRGFSGEMEGMVGRLKALKLGRVWLAFVSTRQRNRRWRLAT